MSLTRRCLLATTLLGSAALAQGGLWWHLSRPGPLPSVDLQLPLMEFPWQLGGWIGSQRPTDEGLRLYGDEHLQRNYLHRDSRQLIALWASYSRHGEDRGHHPEVCLVTAGHHEDRICRQTCPVPGDPDAVQQYRFISPQGESQWVFYWHYTLLPEVPSTGEQLTPLQKFYRRTRRRPSSVTVELFVPEQTAESADAARQFVLLVDAALTRHVGPTAVRGRQRLPVTVVDPQYVPPVP